MDCALPGKAEAAGRVIGFNEASKTLIVDVGLVVLVVIEISEAELLSMPAPTEHPPSRGTRATGRRACTLGPARPPWLRPAERRGRG